MAGSATSRREQLAEQATDWALEHGLIGLSLRPLAAAIGTSDRMLLYHFTDKDDLVATVLRVSNDRSVRELRALPRAPDVRTAVLELWTAATSGQLERCQRLYVEAAALGIFGREPYAAVVREANRHWTEAVGERLVAAGCAPAIAPRAVALLDAAMMGFQLDLPLGRSAAGSEAAGPDDRVDRAVADLADAVAALAAGSPASIVDQGSA